MLNEFSRTELLLGKEAMKKLKESTVAIFGVGGVGSYVVEALARSGVGKFVLFDDDEVCLTNVNRQLIATRKTIGRKKVEVMCERIMDINPNAEVEINACFYLPENADEYDFAEYSYIVDAVDTVTAKLEIIMRAKEKNIPVISSMGAGNKLNPTLFEVSDIYKTSVCPLAKVMRHELKKREIKNLKVVYSKEKPIKPIDDSSTNCKSNCICPPGATRKCTDRRSVPGSISFVPSVAGLIIASEVVKDIVAN
ncbi:tRNA A37 threonylcarbamoyladenosine dehydratase [Sedimentibacter acidaminivorans]|uniref:tRNA A37 threonylcarbamoyladenosine dehydratase n=1 Tax=Sedimentibacter acidaminivorans TaxID=913099 RepID=A0ABS4GH17_9FIRM|nr:tRNA threonylcarbamoyladenosine dehydratase [Sedimentibacter acidaminivorans]MBP1926984.1 tRNA A37 threonylcarbamoyladenosine dehydratase [Sedimentibacter acidaminivorans]